MCAGAAINARVDRVVYGAADPRAGCLGSLINLAAVDFDRCPRVTGGVLADACSSLLTGFFAGLRQTPG